MTLFLGVVFFLFNERIVAFFLSSLLADIQGRIKVRARERFMFLTHGISNGSEKFEIKIIREFRNKGRFVRIG